jgi:hypothetical protein
MAKGKDNSKADNGAETVSSYFRRVFAENPKLLKSRSNEELLQRWLADHPGEKEVPRRVRQNLANIKSVLRKKGRKRGRRQEAEQTETADAIVTPVRRSSRGLEQLEEQIDECLTAAKVLDREGLGHVIRLLRQARNEVVWKLGQ